MSEEREAKRLSMGETHRRIMHLCLDARGIKFGDFLHDLFDKIIHLKEQEQKQADEQSDAHKTAEALAQLAQGQVATRNAAERAADAAERAADLMRRLRPEWLTGDENTPKQYIRAAGNIKMMIFNWWLEYDHDPEDNGGRRSDVATFYELNGAKEIRSGVSLQSFIEDQAAKDAKKRTPEQLIKRIIRSEGARRRNAEKKQKPKPSQKHTA